MKSIVITENQLAFTKYTAPFSNSIEGLELEFVDSPENFIKSYNSLTAINFFMLDAEMKEHSLKSSLNAIIDIAGERPILTCGTPEKLQEIDKSILLKTENNIMFDDIESETKIDKIVNFINIKAKESIQEESVAEAESELDYIPIKVRSLYFTESLPYNLFIKIGSKKMVLAIEKNTHITQSSVAKLLKRKIQFLYIEKDKHLSFLEISMLKASKFLNTQRTLNKKVMLAHLRSTAFIQDYIYNAGVTSSVEMFIDSLLDNMIETLEKSDSIEKVLSSFSFNFESNVGKSILCAYISFFIVQDQGWRSTPIRKKFLLASLIQDIFLDNDELSKLKSLSDPNIINFSESEIKSFSEHHEKIATTAQQLNKFPELDFLLRQHHERARRDGFPNRPSPAELQLAVCVFNMCSQFSLELNQVELTTQNIARIYKYYKKENNYGNYKQPIMSLGKLLNL